MLTENLGAVIRQQNLSTICHTIASADSSLQSYSFPGMNSFLFLRRFALFCK